MKISPMDIQRQAFARRFRGFDQDEVHRLRKLLADSHRGANAYSSKLKTPKKRKATD
jgi:DivIVA domain-containing protein